MEFTNHLKSYLNDEEISSLLESINETSLRAVLLNTKKMSNEEFLTLFPEVTPHPIVKNAYIYNPNIYTLGKTIYHDLGCFYIQEPSAMVPAYLLNANENDIVLDLCAAPGGKSIQTSLLMNNKGFILSNDLSYQRASIIVENAERLGLGNLLITSNDFSKISHKYQSTFSKIILDAPCSGSGMFKKDEKMIKDWSINKVLKFAETQKELILMCFDMLMDGGTLLYSTCSFSQEEDEDVIEYLLDNREAEIINIDTHNSYYINKNKPLGIHLLPHLFPGDGQYICLIKKKGELKITHSNKSSSDYKEFNINNNLYTYSKKYNDYVFALPYLPIDISKLNILRLGLKLGQFKGKDFIYDFHLSRYLTSFNNEVEILDYEVKDYIKGLTLNKESNKGFILVKNKNVPLSFGKSDGHIIKNHYPKHLRR